jgi:hypothetical protein
VIGSYLHQYAYPDWFQHHQDNNQVLKTSHKHSAGKSQCIQLRGEYLYVAEGRKGMRAYDVASIANKGFSQRIITSPASPLGRDTHIPSRDATCLLLPTTQPIAPAQNQGELMRNDKMEQPFHPLFNYAFISDAVEGLILVDVNTLVDGEPSNNFFERALTWNPDNILAGAKHVSISGHYLYIAVEKGVVVVDIDDPLNPQVVTTIPLNDVRATMLQFRYLFVNSVICN